MDDYIKRGALMDMIERLDWYQPAGKGRLSVGAPSDAYAVYKAEDIYQAIKSVPSANVDALPEGKPGDFLLWDTGCGYQKIYAIEGVCIYPDGVRYDLGDLCPVVNHPSIRKVMSREEAEKELRGEKDATD